MILQMKTTKKHNEKHPYIPDHSYRILIIDGSGSGKTYVLLNTLIRGYSLITNKITRSFSMVLLGGINNSNWYIMKIY